MMTGLKKNWPQILLAFYLCELLLLGIQPYDRTTWMAENAVGLFTACVLVGLYLAKIRFSNLAYSFAACYLVLHTIGGHYTFERVPFDWITELFGFSRNHFDRICHFLVGTFAYMAMEFIEEKKLSNSRLFSAIVVVMSVFGLAAVFELVEWIYAEMADSASGAAFLGSQGDIWDAQKDMLADGLGGILCVSLYALIHRRAKGAQPGADPAR